MTNLGLWAARLGDLPRWFAYLLAVWALLAGVWGGTWLEHQRTEQRLAYVGANVARITDEAFDRGVYVSCRTFLEYFFAVSYDQSIVFCLDIMRDSREFGLDRELYWLVGYETYEQVEP